MWPRAFLALGIGARVVVGTSVAFIGCSSTGSSSPYESPNFDGYVPNSGLSDWISYGDYVW